MSNINFANPWLLFSAIPLLAVIIIPFVIAVKKENKNKHNVLSFIFHIIIVLSATLAIAGAGYEAMVTKTNVYVLADVSYSSANNLAVVDGYVHEVEKSLPKNSEMGVIAFGKNYQLLSDMGEKTVSVTTVDKVDKSATDIANALRYAGNLFDDNVIKRIVVITDGADTAGNSRISSVVSSLEEDGVYVDAVYLDNNLPEGVNELQISSVEAVYSSFINRKEVAQISITSNNSNQTRAYLDVDCNGEKQSIAVSLYSGENLVEIPLNTSEAGEYKYTVTLRAEKESDDASPYNNSCLFTQKVSDTAKVLFVGGSRADIYAGQKIYGTDNVTYVTSFTDLPITVEELCKYDEIVLSNFNVSGSFDSTLFLSSLDTVVSKFGKTLSTFGNTFVQETVTEENEALTALGGMLPVSIGNKDKDERLVSLIYDVSTSMNFQSRLSVAKATASTLVETFTERDVVMVVGFSGDIKFLRPARYLDDKREIIAIINGYEPRNGTVLYNAMEYVYSEMAIRNYHHKEMIIISDGLNSDDKAKCLDLAERISASNIVISALGIYPAGNANNTFLNGLVNNKNANGKGYYKDIQTEKDVDYVLKSVTEEMTDVKVEGNGYKVDIRRPQETVLQNVDGFSDIGGFWYNSAKSGAVTVMTAKYFRDKLTSFDVPIYAYWNYGNGKVFSFTSDIVSSEWTGKWNGEDEKNFFDNIKKASLPNERIDSPAIIETETTGTVTRVTVTVSAYRSGATLTVKMTSPDGTIREKLLSYDSENYVCDFDTAEVGIYDLTLTYDYSTMGYTANKSFAISYMPEYDAFTAYSVSSLYRIITGNGETSLDGSLKMDNSDSATRTFSFSFVLPFMILCAFLFVVDIIVRMIRIKDIKSLFSRRNKKGGAL